jgi:hypothetical protein
MVLNQIIGNFELCGSRVDIFVFGKRKRASENLDAQARKGIERTCAKYFCVFLFDYITKYSEHTQEATPYTGVV